MIIQILIFKVAYRYRISDVASPHNHHKRLPPVSDEPPGRKIGKVLYLLTSRSEVELDSEFHVAATRIYMPTVVIAL